ncbi:MAG: DNA mismatch repair protein MutS [Thermoplasmata archaeon]
MGASLTPLLEQYERVRARYPGHLVLFRVGDFYETFGEDAKLLARELDVQLTARAPDAHGQRTPMAGVPHHAVESYLARLVRKGHRVALCDQVEEPADGKGLFRREVTRVVTPGTAVEDGILGGPDHNFLAAAVVAEGAGAWAAVDVSTGEWYHGLSDEPRPESVAAALAPYFPREILVAPAAEAEGPLGAVLRREFPSAAVEASPPPLAEEASPSAGAAPPESPAVALADRSLAAYLAATQPRLLPLLGPAGRGAPPRTLRLDAKTLRHLEISRPMNPDDPSGSTLVGSWDETRTAAGRRTLSFWLTHPLADVGPIRDRQDAVAALVGAPAALAAVREHLSHAPDIGRIASRVVGRRVRPPDLGALRDGLRRLGPLRSALGSGLGSELVERLVRDLVPPGELLATLEASLPAEIPPTLEAGGFLRPGHAEEVDRARAEEDAAVREIEALEREEREATGIRTLHVRYNQIFGYYLEVGRAHTGKVPSHYRRRQTVAQAERYTTDRLEACSARVLAARARVREEELRAWDRLLEEVDRAAPALHRIGRALGSLDALQSFATRAVHGRCVRPEVDESTELRIREGRHPILDRLLAERFVPNDVDLEGEGSRLLVLTGPNMSGKSTYMRQVGLLVVLAQSGAFVPARFARIGRVDGLYTRMGFTDEIGRGKSSFMVEMAEVAEILREATPRSLVLLDEVGRGTSTFDGVAIAWAVLRHLHDTVRARTILATHYHHLTELVERLPSARLAHLAVREHPDGIVFLHRLVPGATDRSYGVHVARLAGLPAPVLEEAQRLLRRLEAEGLALADRRAAAGGGPRYAQAILVAQAAPPSPVEEEIRSIDVERITPVEALRRLAELKARLAGSPPAEGDR